VIQTYSGTRFAGFYFLLQGIAVIAWWAWLIVVPDARGLFVPAGADEVDLMAFMLPDGTVLVSTSLIAAGLFLLGSPWTAPISWLCSGAVLYATTYCLSWALLRESGWLNVLFMLPATLLSCLAAVDVSASIAPLFRSAASATPRRHMAATLAQIIVFWSLFLLVVPQLLSALDDQLAEIPRLSLPGQGLLATTLFTVCSLLGLTCGLTMSRRGEGTPLPFDATNHLVVQGPYGFIRNPMVIAGLGQGLAVALWLSSWVVVAYVVLGGLIWQYVVRPAEERDLHEKFTSEYAQYQRSVRCWVPRLTPYHGDP